MRESFWMDEMLLSLSRPCGWRDEHDRLRERMIPTAVGKSVNPEDSPEDPSSAIFTVLIYAQSAAELQQARAQHHRASTSAAPAPHRSIPLPKWRNRTYSNLRLPL